MSRGPLAEHLTHVVASLSQRRAALATVLGLLFFALHIDANLRIGGDFFIRSSVYTARKAAAFALGDRGAHDSCDWKEEPAWGGCVFYHAWTSVWSGRWSWLVDSEEY